MQVDQEDQKAQSGDTEEKKSEAEEMEVLLPVPLIYWGKKVRFHPVGQWPPNSELTTTVLVVLFTDNRGQQAGEAGQEERAAAATGQEAQGEDEDSGAAGGEQAALAADQ